mgnify:CR=1 FL=1
MKNFNKKIKEVCEFKKNRLCLGLDIDNTKLENKSLDYMQSFIFDIIDATIDLCPVYKINFAFYEKHGSKGYNILENISEKFDENTITIADAKRGDIGNSSKYYAESIFQHFNFDSITVSPYMGYDSILPFTLTKDKGVFVLCLTSNPGSSDIQGLSYNNSYIYQKVITLALKLNKFNNVGLVVGATKTSKLNLVKEKSESLPWLMPGVGFQGGNLEESLKMGESNNKGLAIINVSRGILHANSSSDNYGSIASMRSATEEFTNKIRGIV